MKKSKTSRYEQSLFESTLLASLSAVLMLTVNMILGLLLRYSDWNKDLTSRLLCLAGISVVSTLVPTVIFSLFHRGLRKNLTAYRRHRCHPFMVFAMVMFGTSACLLLNFAVTYLSELFPALGEASEPFQNLDVPTVLLMLFALALVPAVCEELAYRGIVMGILAPCGEGYAVVVSSMIFGLMHSFPTGMIFAFFSGMILGVIRKTTGKLLPVMAVHFLNNAVVVGMTVYQSMISKEENAHFLFIAMIVLAVLTVVWLVLIQWIHPMLRFSNKANPLSTGEKTVQLLVNPAFVVFIILALVVRIF